jgi:acetylornithine deacetylase/succinyl-diaminopimelate desuccinylase-like protein
MLNAEQINTIDRPLTPQQQDWVDRAWDKLDMESLRSLVVDMVGIASPTGGEAPLAEYLTGRLVAAGMRATLQQIDESQANAVGILEGSGGPDLLLYAPIDTLTVGEPSEDVPWIGSVLRPDMRSKPTITSDWVMGLGASNPKGHGACIIAAAEAIAAARVPLGGDLIVGMGAGGMPTNYRTASRAGRRNVGQGVGCSFMIEQGIFPDFAIIAKPGWSVSWEEVGLCWFRIEIKGEFNYVGSRHRLPYRNPIVAAATVIRSLENWFPDYSARNTSGLVTPQGNIGYIHSGWERTASLSPAACILLVDLRISPRTSPAQAKRQFAEAMDRIRRDNAELEMTWEMILSIPGSRTPPQNWIIQASARAWEAVQGKPHEVQYATSGATDANILRNRGIPTARVGMPKAIDDQGLEVDFAMGMNATDLRHMSNLARLLIHAVIATCTSTAETVGIAPNDDQRAAYVGSGGKGE